MKKTPVLKSILAIPLLLSCTATFAYSPEELEVNCQKPHFTDFNLTPYSAETNNEIPAESEVLLKISPWADPKSIVVTAKGKPLPVNIQSNSSFHKVTGKLPAEYNGGFVRINVSAKALLGCYDKRGWLVKVAAK